MARSCGFRESGFATWSETGESNSVGFSGFSGCKVGEYFSYNQLFVAIFSLNFTIPRVLSLVAPPLRPAPNLFPPADPDMASRAAASPAGGAEGALRRRKRAAGRFLEAEYLDVSAKNGNFEP